VTTSDGPLLAAQEVDSGYGDIQVLRRVSLQVWPRKITALLGANGAGKTTMLRTFAGLNPATHGEVRLDGEQVNGLSASHRARRGLGYVMEGKRVFARRSVEENLMLGGYIVTHNRKDLRRRAGRMYERFPVLGERRRARAGELSGGQQQMLAIAQALMAEPRVLMLDEPSAGLAPAIVKDVFAIVTGLRDEGLAVLLVEQAAEAALAIADHVAVLDVGRLVIDQPADRIDDISVVRSAYLGGARSLRDAPATPDPPQATKGSTS
jgi:branched-chain amino acid transport system ATP-binding protein